MYKRQAVFNADSRKRQETNFNSIAKRVQQAKKVFVPVIGYGYGKKRIKPGQNNVYIELAGQDFWTWLTGDADFYLKIVKFMGTRPDQYVEDFKKSYSNALNRLSRDFMNQYCLQDGSIDWDKLVQFNSGSTK